MPIDTTRTSGRVLNSVLGGSGQEDTTISNLPQIPARWLESDLHPIQSNIIVRCPSLTVDLWHLICTHTSVRMHCVFFQEWTV